MGGELVFVVPADPPSFDAHREETFAAGDAFYTVKKKDTLYSIAKRHGLTVAELRELNGLPARASIQPGDRLRVSPARVVTAGGM